VAERNDAPLATEVVPTAADSTSENELTFALQLSATEGTPVTLQANRLDSFTNQPVTLVNEASGTTYELENGSPVRFTPSSATTRLKVRVGSVPNDPSSLTPEQVRLHENYPNPFRDATTIEYDVPEQMSVRIAVFDVLGRRVATLVRGERSPGQYTVTWAPEDRGGLASGVYFLRLRAGGTTKTNRLTFVR